jgi:hypothetical protein
MNRLFKIGRRRANIVDLYTPFVYGVDLYRLKWAQNFDGAFTAIINSTNVGFIDSNVNRAKVETQPTTGTDVRIVFDPTTFAIDDTKSFWLLFVPVTGGVEGTPGAPTLILPESAHKGLGLVTIAGNAPAAALQLDLPFLAADLRVHNEELTNYVFLGSEAGGPASEPRKT